jgi:hypothetical protein
MQVNHRDTWDVPIIIDDNDNTLESSTSVLPIDLTFPDLDVINLTAGDGAP